MKILFHSGYICVLDICLVKKSDSTVRENPTTCGAAHEGGVIYLMTISWSVKNGCVIYQWIEKYSVKCNQMSRGMYPDVSPSRVQQGCSHLGLVWYGGGSEATPWSLNLVGDSIHFPCPKRLDMARHIYLFQAACIFANIALFSLLWVLIDIRWIE